MKPENIASTIAAEVGKKPWQTEAVIKLTDEGCTVPFISRYRKEATGSLTDEEVRHTTERLAYLRNLINRQDEILKSIEDQGKLTPELKKSIESVTKLQEAEDLYLPFKKKRRTRAMIAKEKGLSPLADMIMAQNMTEGDITKTVSAFISEENGIETPDDALAGARDICAEAISEDAVLRQKLRDRLWSSALIACSYNDEKDEKGTYQMYKDYKEPVHHLPPHRVLAINRGEKDSCLSVHIECDDDRIISLIDRHVIKRPSIFSDDLKMAIDDCWKRLLFPSMEREIRAKLTDEAETQAIKVFGVNLKQLLMIPPLSGHTVMGLDPGYRTGCKMAIVDPTGRVLDHGVLHITSSDKARKDSEKKVISLVKKHHVDLLSIGNGTASYETEQFVSSLISNNHIPIHYLITSESGASIYSASELARQELPDYDVTIRGAVSIARRVQDPLAELVKIDPESIGVGQYQHDVNQKALRNTLDAVVEDAVNEVGADLNTASPSLLSHVSGITKTTAINIVKWRDENGRFMNRDDLKKVPRLGPAAFTQCAGFLRISNGSEPLDNTPIHPESYNLASKILQKLGYSKKDLSDKSSIPMIQAKAKRSDPEKIASSLNAGLPTVKDILKALQKPGRDPREDLPKPLTRKSITKLSDLKEGTIMTGTVRNITDFGAFVDIGLKNAGLIHISELDNKYVKHPLDVVSVGDVVRVKIISIDEKRGRIGLSRKQAMSES